MKHWTLEYGADGIERVEIIEFDPMSDDNGYTVLYEVEKELVGDIAADVGAIEFKLYGTNLASHTGRGIKITFVSGEYDIITQKEPKHYKRCENEEHPAHEFDAFNSWLECDRAELYALIEKYLPD